MYLHTVLLVNKVVLRHKSLNLYAYVKQYRLLFKTCKCLKYIYNSIKFNRNRCIVKNKKELSQPVAVELRKAFSQQNLKFEFYDRLYNQRCVTNTSRMYNKIRRRKWNLMLHFLIIFFTATFACDVRFARCCEQKWTQASCHAKNKQKNII